MAVKVKRASVPAGWDKGHDHTRTRVGEYATDADRDADRCWFCRAICSRAPSAINVLLANCYKRFLAVYDSIEPLERLHAGLSTWHDPMWIRESAQGKTDYLPHRTGFDPNETRELVPEADLIINTKYLEAHQEYSKCLLEWLRNWNLDVDWMITRIHWGFHFARLYKLNGGTDTDELRAEFERGFGDDAKACGNPLTPKQETLTFQIAYHAKGLETAARFRERAMREFRAVLNLHIAKVHALLDAAKKTDPDRSIDEHGETMRVIEDALNAEGATTGAINQALKGSFPIVPVEVRAFQKAKAITDKSLPRYAADRIVNKATWSDIRETYSTDSDNETSFQKPSELNQKFETKTAAFAKWIGIELPDDVPRSDKRKKISK